jgi:hypothetical protein
MAAGCGRAPPTRRRGVHQPQNKEDKVACLVSLHSARHDEDPQPEPPPSFVEPRRLQRLLRQMKGLPGEPPAEADEADQADAAAVVWATAAEDRGRPERLVRTCVASRGDSRSLGPLVPAQAQERDFERRAFVADGAAYNWSIHHGYFADCEPIADLLHVLC